jgi:hypothetical protein
VTVVAFAQVLTARITEVSRELAKMSADEKLVPFTLNNDLMMVSCTALISTSTQIYC